MADDNNSHNLLYFEAPSMRELYETMDRWQKEKNKRLLSVSVEKDNSGFCCIALTNPSEVVIVDGDLSGNQAHVYSGAIRVETSRSSYRD